MHCARVFLSIGFVRGRKKKRVQVDATKKNNTNTSFIHLFVVTSIVKVCFAAYAMVMLKSVEASNIFPLASSV